MSNPLPSSTNTPTPIAPLCLLTCEAGRVFATGVADELALPLVPSTEHWFASGEGKLVIDANIRGCDAYIFQSCVGDDDRTLYDRFVMLLHAVEAARLADAMFVTAVLPYYPGARQDKRKGRTREGISAGLFARMLTAAGAHRVLSIEIHNAAIGGMFDAGRTTLEAVYLHKHMAEWIASTDIKSDVVVAPDVGGLERARNYAEQLQLGLAAISKERDYSQPNHVASATLIGEVRGRNVLIVDDIIDTAGSVVAAIGELKKQGAQDIAVACAHPVFSGPAWQRLAKVADRAAQEGWRFQVLGTSLVRHRAPPAWYRAFLVEPLVARVLTTINSRGSVTGL